MTDEDRPRKITIRLTEQEFLALDAKRARVGSKFQQIGLNLLRAWLDSTAAPGSEDNSTRAKIIQAGELTQEPPRDYSRDSEVPQLGTSLAKLLEKYGWRAVDILADAILRMPEVSLAERPEAAPPDIVRYPQETKNHEGVGGRLPRKRRPA